MEMVVTLAKMPERALASLMLEFCCVCGVCVCVCVSLLVAMMWHPCCLGTQAPLMFQKYY